PPRPPPPANPAGGGGPPSLGGSHPSAGDDMTNEPAVTRVGFRLQVRPDLIDEYRVHHAAVWPEMLAALERCGWHRYSLFLDDDGTLFGYFETPGSLDDAVAAMQSEPVNERW